LHADGGEYDTWIIGYTDAEPLVATLKVPGVPLGTRPWATQRLHGSAPLGVASTMGLTWERGVGGCMAVRGVDPRHLGARSRDARA
jgi:hypothetical protein